jgi:hypothetical protein
MYAYLLYASPGHVSLRSTSQSAAPPPPPPPLSCGKAKPCSASTVLVSVIAAFSGACRALFESCQVTLAFGARTAGEQHLDCYCNMTARISCWTYAMLFRARTFGAHELRRRK